MKKLLTFSMAVLCVAVEAAYTQGVAINTDGSAANSSAMLDIKSTTRGLLAPRMTGAQRTAIASPATGLLVYDTDTNSFWYYNGSAWGNLSSIGTSGWSLTGNTGTVPTTNFIGTTDNQPLRLRVNNTWAGEISPSSGNTALGFQSGLANTTGIFNTGNGHNALNANTTGSYNAGIGSYALFSNTIGQNNTAIGSSALVSNVAGSGATAIGYHAMFNANSQTTAFANYNVAVGYESLNGSALAFQNTGNYNTAIGYQSIYSNTGGIFNTAVGYLTLNKNNTGVSNSAFGANALYSNTMGGENTAIGLNTLFSNTIGIDNTAVGVVALYNSSTGNRNTAVGYSALFNLSSGNSNCAFGVAALMSATIASYNVAIGDSALYKNTALGNTAVGSFSLANNEGGFYNSASGYFSLSHNTSGIQNSAVGTNALESNSTGNNNTAVGVGADNDGPALSNNTIIGATAHIDASGSTAIGYGASTNTNNLIVLGTPSIAYTGGYVPWSIFSDGRFKKNVTENVKGLDFILKLRPVTYQMDVKGLYNFWGTSPYGHDKTKADEKAIAFIDDAIKKKEAVVMTGFVAQEVEQAAKNCGYNFDGVIHPQHDKDHYRLAYEEFVVPLVKAVQEQQALILKQQAQIDALVKRIDALEKK